MQSNRPVRRNVRYDRILAILVVIILLLVLLVRCVSSCSSGGSSSSSTAGSSTAGTTTSTEQTTTVSQYANAVYLSPSTQADNTFATGTITEAAYCQDLANAVASLLQASGVTVFVGGSDQSATEKVRMGDNDLGAYVGIQTNQGVGSGTSCYYNGTASYSARSRTLAEDVYNNVAALTTRDDNGLIDGSDSTSDYYEYEIGMNQSPCCIIEVEYHDTATIAQWLQDNESAIANAIASGICAYLGVTYTSGGAATTTPLTTSTTNAIDAQLSG